MVEAGQPMYFIALCRVMEMSPMNQRMAVVIIDVRMDGIERHQQKAEGHQRDND